jgi:Transposase DDE domain/Transposase domain (DUF772)
MLKIVLLAYSRGLVTSRKPEAACEHNILFMAISGDARPSYTHIAKFVRELGPDIQSLFTQVLMTCDRLGLIGRSMFGRALADDNDPSHKMRRAIDSAQGRRLYSRRIATVEPVFANIRHHKRMSRFTLRGKAKVSTQWQLYCLVHNIEKIATQAMRAS